MATLQTSKSSDSDLLTRFAREKDDVAFATLMRRHWCFVYSVAQEATGSSGQNRRKEKLSSGLGAP
ncbi:MAG: hypothetical protein QNL33_19645 [Akkermansiaceae bacterium]|jgi:hypothetical protein